MNTTLQRVTFFMLAFIFMTGISLPHQRAASAQGTDTPTPEAQVTPYIITAADVINAVNNLRLASGLNTLSIHPVLMQVAALQASALAASEGAVGHQRPCGMTLGQQLLWLGFPLWGDLSMDGYRSENWGMAETAEGAVTAWLGDELHANTMLSPNRSDIGAAVVAGEQTYYVVLETALKTNSGQHQSTAYDILTGIPMTQTLCAGFASGEISDYSVPVVVSTARPDGDVIHEVQYGQTLWTLADMYHVSIEQIKRLNGLTTDTIVPGWKLLIQKAATQPAPVTDTPLSRFTPTETPYPTAIPYHSPTPSPTATVAKVPLGEQIKQNRMVVAALLIAFSVLLAGIIGFGRRKEE
jgi:uncharacterized protein YkwD